jgi:hypothetical protein
MCLFLPLLFADIEPGQGMVYVTGSTTAYRAVTCNSGRNYGVRTRQYELRLTPCRECPEATITFGTQANGAIDPANFCTTRGQSATYRDATTTGYITPEACCTMPGFGFDGNRAALCARGK